MSGSDRFGRACQKTKHWGSVKHSRWVDCKTPSKVSRLTGIHSNPCSVSSYQKKTTSRHIIMPVVTLSINMITLTVYYGDNTAFAHTFTHLFLEPDSLSSLIPEAVGMGGRDGRIRLMFEKKSKWMNEMCTMGIVVPTKSLNPCADVLPPQQQVAYFLSYTGTKHLHIHVYTYIVRFFFLSTFNNFSSDSYS